MLELIQASVWRSRSLPTRSHPRRRRSKSRCATGESDLCFARVSLGDQSPNRPDRVRDGPDFARGVPLEDLAEGSMILGQAAGEAVVLARAGGALFAIGAECTHYHGPLAEGMLVADTVRCPWPGTMPASACAPERHCAPNRWPFSPRIWMLKSILAKLRPEPVRQPLSPVKHHEPPRATAARRRRAGRYLAISLISRLFFNRPAMSERAKGSTRGPLRRRGGAL